MDRESLFATLSGKKTLLMFGVLAVLAGAGGWLWWSGRIPFLPRAQKVKPLALKGFVKHADADAYADEQGLSDPTKPSLYDLADEAFGETESFDSEVAEEEPAPLEVKKPEGAFGRLVGTYADAWTSVEHKVEELREDHEENARLRLENANLRLQVESLQFSCTNKKVAESTSELEQKLVEKTGAKMGRTLASISYRPPTHLLPDQLYTLAVSYFGAHELEKAAVIMTLLTDMEENHVYQNPKDYLMTGILWYRLDNYELADQYFEKVLKSNETTEVGKYFAQARLWKALTAERENKHTKAQYWLQELIDHHPQSTEANWINRMPAASKEEAGARSD